MIRECHLTKSDGVYTLLLLTLNIFCSLLDGRSIAVVAKTSMHGMARHCKQTYANVVKQVVQAFYLVALLASFVDYRRACQVAFLPCKHLP